MTNVVRFHGAMHPRNALRTGPLTEAELDAQIADNRERYDAACEAAQLGVALPPASTRRAPSLIPLDNSLRARLIRWLRGLSLKGPLT